MPAVYYIENNTNNNLNYYLLSLLYLISIYFAYCVIIKKNPIVSVLCLIALFFLVSLYLASIGLVFIALSYLLVYVGAVSILFLFILMLIDIRISELYTNTNNSLILLFITALSLIIILVSLLPKLIPTTVYNYNPLNYFNELFLNKISYVSAPCWESNVMYNSHITSLGNIMYTSSAILLIITSFVLLLAMVGTIVITLNRQDAKKDYTESNK